MTTTSSPYCDFVDTNQVFNKKRVYQCSYCNLRLGLEDPSAKILCFKKMQDFRVSVQKLNDPSYEEPIHLTPDEPMQNIILEAAVKKYGIKEQTKEDPSNMCSQEEIQQRLNICEQCEHYKDNSCLLCGCVIVRESNYMNKLAHKDQQCPINKWSAIQHIKN
jgi:hypothetical protein